MATLIIKCAWCDNVLGEKDDPGGAGGITHGICDDCLRRNFPHIAERVERIENQCNFPKIQNGVAQHHAPQP